jgi:acyl carrier protein
MDNQVKIRGFRIELGEIETVLSQHPVVRQSVVIVREDSPGDKRLVAYVVSNQDQVCTGSALRNFLKEKLPEYMVPSAFVVLDAFPLTPNGKLDRKALPVPDQIRPQLQESFVVARTPIEEIIAEVWAEVLKLEKVGIHDNFFDLGGHSLLATQIISRVRDAFQMDIPLRTLFEKPTVEELAIAIMHHSREQISEKELSGILNDLESLSKDELKQGLV